MLTEDIKDSSQLILKSPHAPNHIFIASSNNPILQTHKAAIQQEIDGYILKTQEEIQNKTITEDCILSWLQKTQPTPKH